jgi:hypothetical protein
MVNAGRLGLRALVAAGLIVAGRGAGAADASPQGPPEAPPPVVLPAVDAVKVIADLGAADPEARRRAALRLNSMGGDALPAVEQALADPAVEPETAARLRAAAPFLRARARREARERAREAYLAETWEAAYRAAGRTDPAYDADALAALHRYRTDKRLTPDARKVTLDAFRRAAEKGCRNPLFRIGYGSVAGLDRHLIPSEFDAGGGYGELLKYASDTNPPPAVRFELCTKQLASEPIDVERFAKAAAGAVAALAADRAAPAGLADDLAMAHFGLYRPTRHRDFEKAAAAFLDGYSAGAAGRPGYHLFQGTRLTHAAWAARGYGFADTVGPDAWRLFKERLDAAHRELEEAWRRDPTDARVCDQMIVVHMGLGTPREEMEAWFARAMETDPDDAEACARKLYYLYPRWHGSHEQMVAFGRECLATRNWRGGLPFVLLDAHEAIAKEVADPAAYFRAAAVWDDVRAVYDGHLVNAPDDAKRRSQFARYAVTAEQWVEADAQFRALGDRADYAPFGGKATYDYLKRKAARLAKGAGK